jgi:hypothetical protein
MAETPRRRREHVKFKPRSATPRTGTPTDFTPSDPFRGAESPSGPGTGPAAKASKGKPTKPRIEISRPAASAPLGRVLVLCVLLIIALVAAGLHAMARRPDPHFLSATTMLNEYERGREEEARNYTNEVYERALSDLALVNSESVSYEEAHALRQDIEARREAFFAKVREAERDRSVRRTANDEKRAEFAAKQNHSRMHPQVEYPECDE